MLHHLSTALFAWQQCLVSPPVAAFPRHDNKAKHRSCIPTLPMCVCAKGTISFLLKLQDSTGLLPTTTANHMYSVQPRRGGGPIESAQFKHLTKIRISYLTPAFSGAQKRAELLRNPYILGVPSAKRGDKIRSVGVHIPNSKGHTKVWESVSPTQGATPKRG